jgi:hypothetical protein
MKIKRVFRIWMAFTLATFLVMGANGAWAGNTSGANPSINVPLDNPADNDEVVISPFWQHAGSTYTFVSISHPSLSGMNSEIGLTATAFLGDGTGASSYGTSVDFTVSAGETQRLFIFGTPSSVTLFNTNTIPGANFILGTSNGGTGYLRFDPVASNPKVDGGSGFQDVTMLSYWGAIVFNGLNTGFAMEFIGDLNDSSAHPGQGSTKFPAGVN